MKITDVRVRKISDGGKLKAVGSVSFDGQFVVHDIKIIEGINGLFIAMPSRRTKDGEFRDVCHPITSEFRSEVENEIYKAYKELPDEEKENIDEEKSAEVPAE